jgi:hypothetical protein
VTDCKPIVPSDRSLFQMLMLLILLIVAFYNIHGRKRVVLVVGRYNMFFIIL